MEDRKIKTCKDRDPRESVRKFRSILRNLDIEVEEIWHRKSCYGTYSMNLVIKDTQIGTWGKGCTKDLARASAYGEFFERYLNGFLTEPLQYGDSKYLYSEKEKYLSPMDVISQNCIVINNLFRLNNISSIDKENKAKWLRKAFPTQHQGKYLCVPYTDYKSGKIVYLPISIMHFHYGSNGMAAGNTKEEALVEGLSEILERHAHTMVVMKKITMPDIPESYINKFPSIKEMWNILKKQKGYNVFLKDASLGGKWPVVSLIVINKKTKRYGIRFGAHPNFEIAAQRVFTEAAQGIKLQTFSNIHCLYDKNIEKENKYSYCNIYTGGLACYPTEIFKNKATFPFKATNINSTNNKKLLNYLTNLIYSNKYKILVNDTSCFDIPAFHIIVPGMSEIFKGVEPQMKRSNELDVIKKFMLDVSKINKNNAKKIIETLNYYAIYHQLNDLNNLLPKNNNLEIPCGKNINGRRYFVSMLYFMLKDYKNAYLEYKKISNQINFNTCKQDMIIYKAIENYLELRKNGKTHKYTIQILGKFYKKDTCDFINYTFSSESKVIVKQYPIIKNMLEHSKEFYPYRISKITSYKLLKCREIYKSKK